MVVTRGVHIALFISHSQNYWKRSFIENKSHGGVGSTCSVVECGLWSGRWALDLEVNLKVRLFFVLFSFVVSLCVLFRVISLDWYYSLSDLLNGFADNWSNCSLGPWLLLITSRLISSKTQSDDGTRLNDAYVAVNCTLSTLILMAVCWKVGRGSSFWLFFVWIVEWQERTR